MNKYKLIKTCSNTYNQTSYTTICGYDNNIDGFLERVWKHFEEEIKDNDLIISVNEPNDFDCSGGFVGIVNDDWIITENGTKLPNQILIDFGF